MQTTTKHKTTRKVPLQVAFEDIGICKEHGPHWTVFQVGKTETHVKRQLANKVAGIEESNEFYAKAGLGRREPYPSKVEPLSAEFRGDRFLVLSVKRPEGWKPESSLDLPSRLSDERDDGSGYEWEINEAENHDGFQSREGALRDAAKVNAAGPTGTMEADDWWVVVEVGQSIGHSTFNVSINHGVGRIEIVEMAMPIEVVKPTASEIELYAKPMRKRRAKAVA